MDKDYLLIVFVGMILGFALLFSLLLPATATCSGCITLTPTLHGYPYPMPELRREFLPVIANASLPTPAPTMNPFPTITYPPPVTPVP